MRVQKLVGDDTIILCDWSLYPGSDTSEQVRASRFRPQSPTPARSVSRTLGRRCSSLWHFAVPHGAPGAGRAQCLHELPQGPRGRDHSQPLTARQGRLHRELVGVRCNLTAAANITFTGGRPWLRLVVGPTCVSAESCTPRCMPRCMPRSPPSWQKRSARGGSCAG